jgi:hypothetical protein
VGLETPKPKKEAETVMLSPRASERVFLVGFGLIYVVLVAASFYVINASTQSRCSGPGSFSACPTF